MGLGRDSRKLQVIVSAKDASMIDRAASEDNRSVSNWVYTIIKERLEQRRKG